MVAPDCLIIGGGLAGTAVAFALSRHGIRSVIIDKIGIAAEASGNPAGLAVADSGRSAEVDPRDIRGFEALSDAIGFHQRGGHLSGALNGDVVQFPVTPRLAERCLVGAVSARHLSQLTAARCLSDGLICRGISVDPSELCRAHVISSGAGVVIGEVSSLGRVNGKWRALSRGEILGEAPVVCIANGAAAMALPLTGWLKLERVRGQVVIIRASFKGLPKIPVCFDGYVLPISAGGHLIGADYDHISVDSRVHPGISSALIRRMNRWLEVPISSEAILSGRVAFRTSTHDRLPYVGFVPDYWDFRGRVDSALKARRPVAACEALLRDLSYLPNCFVSVGHGSRGLLSAHYAAELLTPKILAGCGSGGDGAEAGDEMLDPRRLMVRMMRDLRRARS
jgi:tRNA 5-methylaminomethyl-2-thiouridine biosynthesis bifunctional protein